MLGTRGGTGSNLYFFVIGANNVNGILNGAARQARKIWSKWAYFFKDIINSNREISFVIP